MLDIGGIIDPTPATDGTSALISTARGETFDAAISIISILPYAGDTAKLAKVGKYLDTLATLAKRAANNPQLARTVEPMLEAIVRTLDDAIALVPKELVAQLQKLRDAAYNALINAKNSSGKTFSDPQTSTRGSRWFGETDEAVERYWDEYAKAVGRAGDSLEATIKNLESLGYSVRRGEVTRLIKVGKEKYIIEYASDAKVWELYEEALHHSVTKGLGADAIARLTKELRKKFWRNHIKEGSPADAAEEIFVKQQLLLRIDLDDATRTVLQRQIDQHFAKGMSGGY